MWDVINTFVLLGTGIVVYKYTKATQYTNEINEAPLINVVFLQTNRNNGPVDGDLVIENVGHGPAYNISLEKILLENYSYRFFLDNKMLAPKERQKLKMSVRGPNNEMEASGTDLFLTRLDGQKGSRGGKDIDSKNNPAIFLVHCLGISGKKYHFVFALYSPIVFSIEMVVQFVMRGNGKITIEQARQAWDKSEVIRSSIH